VGSLLGYARVSTVEQTVRLQTDALAAAGCFRVFTDVEGGAKSDRPQLALLLDQLRPGDSLVVWRLDRLGRSLRHLIDTLTDLDAGGVGFRSLTESIDTTTVGGRLVFHIFGALAEFERDLVRSRTNAGLYAARARGRLGGRPRKMTPDKVAAARRLYAARELTLDEIAAALGVGRTTLYTDRLPYRSARQPRPGCLAKVAKGITAAAQPVGFQAASGAVHAGRRGRRPAAGASAT